MTAQVIAFKPSARRFRKTLADLYVCGRAINEGDLPCSKREPEEHAAMMELIALCRMITEDLPDDDVQSIAKYVRDDEDEYEDEDTD